MSFNSLQFLIFFPLVVGIYFSISHKYRWILLLLSSYYFYMSWKPEYIILIMISTLIDYVSGIKIHEAKTAAKKKAFLALSLFSNLGLLFAFKYFNFFSDSVREVLSQFSIQLDPFTVKLLLPVGISFYTFQTLSYTIDIYREKIKPQRHLGIFAVYVSFFPQLVAGPIERAKHLIPQFSKKQHFDYKRVTDGLKLMLWGFFKKVVIADRLAVVVDTIYNTPTEYSGIPLILGTIFFAFQIFCDFSGYSDIAIGASKVLGFDLMDNFKRPYFSRSLSEFWKRWHISLSSWFKDYLYIPLGGNRVKKTRWLLNIMVVFIVSGLWHGASWTFAIWGALHGLYLILAIITRPLKSLALSKLKLDKFPQLITLFEITITFILVNIGWIFFRANTVSDAFYIVSNIFQNLSFNFKGVNIGVGWTELAIAFALIAFMEFIHLIQEQGKMRQFLDDKPRPLRWTIYLSLIFGIIFLGVFEKTEFIYFQF